MRVLKYVMLAAGLAVTAATPSKSDAGYGGRQYYSSWHNHGNYGYHYRTYYYKPYDNYHTYKHHYVVYQPKYPKHYYFYNPYKKQYWGRCPTTYCDPSYTYNPNQAYSLLKDVDRGPTIGGIPENKFPPPAAMPPIPESTDGQKVELPPDDLPADVPNAANGIPKAG